jgi:hypothetical protein
MLPNGSAGTVLTSRGTTLSPQWAAPRGYTVPFGLTIINGITGPTYLYSNVGPAGLLSENADNISNGETRFVVPLNGTLGTISVAWDTATTGTITIFRDGTSIYPSGAVFGTPATRVITLASPQSVTAGQYIEVKANKGGGLDDGIFGRLNVVLYFT